eukprot:SAG31_NODE_10908_length_1085_cov_1.099391_1_plen_102_part_00
MSPLEYWLGFRSAVSLLHPGIACRDKLGSIWTCTGLLASVGRLRLFFRVSISFVFPWSVSQVIWHFAQEEWDLLLQRYDPQRQEADAAGAVSDRRVSTAEH